MQVKVKFSLCFTNYALHHGGVWRSGCIDPHYHDLGTSWGVSRQLHAPAALPRGKNRYPLDRRLGATHSQSRRRGEVKILQPYRDSNSDPSVVQPVVSIPTEFM
jgi:hypothetical protein